MAKAAHLQAILSAVDRISPVLNKVTGEALRTRTGLGVLNNVNFAGARRQLGMLRKTVADVGASSRELLAGVGLPISIGLGAVGFGLVAAARGAVAYAGALQDASDNTGMAIGPLQEYQTAFEAAGVSSDDFTGAVTKLNKGMAEAGAGENKGLAALLTKLRIPLRDARGQIRSVEAILPQLADAFSKNENPAVRTRMAMELFSKSGAKLIATMKGGGAAMMAARADALRLGAVLSNESTGKLDDLGDAFGVLGRQVRVQVAEAFGLVGPPVLMATKALQEWIAKNKEMLQSKVGAAITNIATAFKAWVDSGGIERLAAGIEGAVRSLARFVDGFGGVRNVLLGLGALILIGPVSSLATLTLALGRMALVAGPMLLGLYTSIKTLGWAVVASPLGLAFVAIAAVIAGATYLIYRNWDKVGPYFVAAWAGIKGIALAAWDGLKSIFSRSVLAWLINNWSQVQPYLDGIWSGIVAVVGVAFDVVKTLLAWSPVGLIVSNWQPISTFMGAVWKGVTTAAAVAFNLLRFVFAWSPLGILASNWGPITEWMGALWTRVIATASAAFDVLRVLFDWSPLGVVINNWGPIAEFVGQLWGAVKGLVTSGLGAIDALLGSWNPLRWVAAAWDPVVTFLRGIADRISATVGPMVSGIGGAASAVGNWFGNKFGAGTAHQYGPTLFAPAAVGVPPLPQLPQVPQVSQVPQVPQLPQLGPPRAPTMYSPQPVQILSRLNVPPSVAAAPPPQLPPRVNVPVSVVAPQQQPASVLPRLNLPATAAVQPPQIVVRPTVPPATATAAPPPQIIVPRLAAPSGLVDALNRIHDDKTATGAARPPPIALRPDGPLTPTGTPLALAGAMQAPTARVQGDMRVRFENAPAGMRVESATTDTPGLTQSVDVGYRGRSIG